MRRLDCLQIHKSLHAGEEHEAGALAGDCANSAKHPGWVLGDLLVLCAHHQGCHHLAEHDKDTSQDGCFLGVEPFQEETRQDSKKRKSIQHEVKPVENIVINLVLLLKVVEVSEMKNVGQQKRQTRSR